MATSPPFVLEHSYGPRPSHDSRFPTTTFDPKAITRASWEPKTRKPKPTGPLVSFNTHPDAHLVLAPQRKQYLPLGSRTKQCIKWLRVLQLALRVLQLNGALGVLVLMILISRVEAVTAWIMRAGFALMHCSYGVYHLSRTASGRTPATSAAYQVFAAIADLCIMSIYAFGAFTVHKSADTWTTLLVDQSLMYYFVPAVYYTLIGAGGLHFVTLSISLWLGIIFRRISLMPPDMNPLEDHLTARPYHGRNKSSTTMTSSNPDEKRLSTPLGDPLSPRDMSRPPSIPFMHTRTGSSHSLASQGDYAGWQHQNASSNPLRDSSPSSWIGASAGPRSFRRDSYAELPMAEPGSPQRDHTPPRDTTSSRKPRFTETWAPTDSLISRTNQRNSVATGYAATKSPGAQPYAALPQRYQFEDSSDSEYEEDHGSTDEGVAARAQAQSQMHPNPLRSHPPPNPALGLARDKTPPLSAQRPADISSNDFSSSKVITEQRGVDQSSPWRSQRLSSIQLDDDFYSVPYGQLKSAKPPIMIGSNRKVSTGNDFGSKYSLSTRGRRAVSGREAEEGVAVVCGP